MSAEFDSLFSTKTGYQALDNQIAKTMDKKSELLMALKHPEVPLHNNESELGMRSIAEGSESTGSQTRHEPAYHDRRRYKG